MDSKNEGAWIVHHSQKLRFVANATKDYEQIDFAGKCGTILNSLSASEQNFIPDHKIEALAKAAGYSTRTDLPAILDELERQKYIDKSQGGIEVLGLTSDQTLEVTSTIFKEGKPESQEYASLDLAEKSSFLPLEQSYARQYISDTYRMPRKDVDDFLIQSSQIGFVDSENAGSSSLFFNGNLFRKDDVAKINGVLSSLTQQDERKAKELSDLLDRQGCVPQSFAKNILGESLYSRLVAIGFIDENGVGNESGNHYFITKPSAFSKFTNSEVDDAFDLAKAFVTSLMYGMVSSEYSRGRITMIEKLMAKLLRGEWVGPASAIGQDYKVLELKGVVETKPTSGGRFSMRLLKKDVGRLAMSVIQNGEASSESILNLPSVSLTDYSAPESNRYIERKRQAEPLKKGVAELLNDLRTGGIK